MVLELPLHLHCGKLLECANRVKAVERLTAENAPAIIDNKSWSVPEYLYLALKTVITSSAEARGH